MTVRQLRKYLNLIDEIYIVDNSDLFGLLYYKSVIFLQGSVMSVIFGSFRYLTPTEFRLIKLSSLLVVDKHYFATY